METEYERRRRSFKMEDIAWCANNAPETPSEESELPNEKRALLRAYWRARAGAEYASLREVVAFARDDVGYGVVESKRVAKLVAEMNALGWDLRVR